MPKHGTITPSQFKKIMTKGRGKDAVFGQTAHTYADEIVLDLLGVEREQITAAALEHGNELEPFARERYESEQFASVQIVNEPIVHPEFDFVAGTPDGLIGDDGIISEKHRIGHTIGFIFLSDSRIFMDYRPSMVRFRFVRYPVS
jgi:hypothetical protein